MSKRKLKIGKEYKITFYDHFSTEDKAPEEVQAQKVIITSWGRLIAITSKYYVMCTFYENDTSSNNDNIHIAKSTIIKVKEIR